MSMIDGAEGLVEFAIKAIGLVTIVWPFTAFVTYKFTKASFPKAVKFVMAAVILGPPSVVFILISNARIAAKNNQAAYEKTMQDHKNHFVSLCNKRAINVISKIQSKEPHGILNERHPRFAGGFTDVIWSRSLLPKHANISFFEERRDGAFIESEKRYSQFYVRIERDDPDEKGKNVLPSSKYVLEAGQEQSSDNGWTLKSTIKLSERSTARLIADTDLYFFQRRTGDYGCPDLNMEVSKMLSEVFD
jgi:hypothetical protein